MPRYEYRCRGCGDQFEMSRPMARSGDPATCPQGHTDSVKLLSTVALGGGARGSAGPAAGGPAPAPSGGGGCCGGGCCG
ncbi:FmdB family zinc ribbon protein [Streptomyces lonarensis]|uniref:Zinc ribbon domain-containing protein n=1 Tax=Streptomyces lonarensis TaxID=700599 RepID=A0A7X6D2Q8_9ACTN|nr:zinc ribbon domain-containing protein [Streptomyces lonarensis]NJQ07112.1 zinc ribbon domain-containing protein [Streptomyces lonarensis]